MIAQGRGLEAKARSGVLLRRIVNSFPLDLMFHRNKSGEAIFNIFWQSEANLTENRLAPIHFRILSER